MNRTLTDTEIAGFLLRNPVIAVRVGEFNSIVANLGYDQAPTPPGGFEFWKYDVVDYWLRRLPGWIPSWGLACWDSSLGGWVVIFPAAQGFLRFTLSDNSGAAFQINKPPFTSPDPPGGSPLDMLWLLALVVVGAVVVGQARGR